MSTAKEIEAAILGLPPENERQKLVEDLPGILPELDGDAAGPGSLMTPGHAGALGAGRSNRSAIEV